MWLLYTLLLQILNSYMSLIMDKHKDIYIFSTFFYTKLLVSGYQGICNWAKTIPLFTKKFVMVPLHLSNHWSLVAIDMVHCQIILHDSLPNNSIHCLDILEQYLLLEAAKQNFAVKIWIKEVCKECPQRSNFNNYTVVFMYV